MLTELLAYEGDQLSNYQDAVASESELETNQQTSHLREKIFTKFAGEDSAKKRTD